MQVQTLSSFVSRTTTYSTSASASAVSSPSSLSVAPLVAKSYNEKFSDELTGAGYLSAPSCTNGDCFLVFPGGDTSPVGLVVSLGDKSRPDSEFAMSSRSLVLLCLYDNCKCFEEITRSSFARCLIEVNSEADLVLSMNGGYLDVIYTNDGFQTVGKKKKRKGKSKSTNGEADLVDVVTIDIPSLFRDGFTKETIRVEYEWRPPRCDLCKLFGHVHDHCPKKVVSPSIVIISNVVTPTVEKTNDGFQTVGKNKKRKAFDLDLCELGSTSPPLNLLENWWVLTFSGSRAVQTHMRILSVFRIKVFSMYGYDYMKKIVLRRADLNEHIIAERDFKYLYPSSFEDLYLLNLQGHLNHLPPNDKKILTCAVNLWTRHLVIRQHEWILQESREKSQKQGNNEHENGKGTQKPRKNVEDFHLRIESYQTQLNLTKPQWDATGFEYKYDFTVINSLRAVTFRDKYGVQMIMRFNEIHKFSDETLHHIDEALDYRVKEFKVNRMNPGFNSDGTLHQITVRNTCCCLTLNIVSWTQ
uniref:Zinc knuckle CX2CX4HX4C n=1 Tax=Tanacetum cinerariifolium TaxID=118510 RepID=A0A6L2MCF3_TANCI|nr:hypothetical protein [Tanacetum cinerariifolium]